MLANVLFCSLAGRRWGVAERLAGQSVVCSVSRRQRDDVKVKLRIQSRVSGYNRSTGSFSVRAPPHLGA